MSFLNITKHQDISYHYTAAASATLVLANKRNFLSSPQTPP